MFPQISNFSIKKLKIVWSRTEKNFLPGLSYLYTAPLPKVSTTQQKKTSAKAHLHCLLWGRKGEFDMGQVLLSFPLALLPSVISEI